MVSKVEYGSGYALGTGGYSKPLPSAPEFCATYAISLIAHSVGITQLMGVVSGDLWHGDVDVD